MGYKRFTYKYDANDKKKTLTVYRSREGDPPVDPIIYYFCKVTYQEMKLLIDKCKFVVTQRDGYLARCIGDVHYLFHREVMGLDSTTSPEDPREVRYKDKDPTNLRLSNLEVVTPGVHAYYEAPLPLREEHLSAATHEVENSSETILERMPLDFLLVEETVLESCYRGGCTHARVAINAIKDAHDIPFEDELIDRDWEIIKRVQKLLDIEVIHTQKCGTFWALPRKTDNE